MKKLTKIVLLFICFFIISGCNIYVYNFDEDNSQSNNSSSDLTTNNGSGTTIITPETDYNGFVNINGQAPQDETSWDIIYNKVKSSVVTIRKVVDGEIKSTGSGVFFAEDSLSNGYAYIFTNAHVVKGATSIEVLLHNEMMVEGTLIGYDENEDVAVIKIAKNSSYNYKVATLRETATLKIGEGVLAVGSPLGEKYSMTATTGIISNLNIAMTPENTSLDLYLIQVDAALNPGNSGGPLFDNAGNLIGINTMKLLSTGATTSIESFNYAIPISHFNRVATYLLQGSLYYRPFLNITIIDIRLLSSAERKSYSLSLNHGLLILEMGANSPLKNLATSGDVITHIQGVEVTKASDFSVELLKYKPNDTIQLTISNANGEDSANIDITLIKR